MRQLEADILGMSKQLEKPENKKVPRAGKTKMYLLILVVGAGLTVAGLYYKDNNDSNVVADNSVPEVNGEDKKDETVVNYLEGTLNNSDNLSLGNFKLVSGNSDIYLRTTRDFSRLVGMQVMVLINGTMEKFELVDIQSKVSNDSYILPQ